MSPALKAALKDILKVVDEKSHPTWFCPEDGLCFNVQSWGEKHLNYDFGLQLRVELQDLFGAEGLHHKFPFNKNTDDFWQEVEGSENLRWKNPKRMAWLKEHAQ